MKKSILKRTLLLSLVIILIMSLLSSLYVSAEETEKRSTGAIHYTMNVGETKTLYLDVNEAVTSASWRSTWPDEVVITESDSFHCKIRVDKYVKSSVLIHCVYNYLYYDSYWNMTTVLSDYKDFYIDINPPKDQGGNNSGGSSSHNNSKSIKLTLDPCGGKVSKNTIRATAGTAVGKLPTPKRNGYFFDGWYTAKNGGSKVYSSTSFSNSRTLYAHWTKSIKITLKPCGGKLKKYYKAVRKNGAVGKLAKPTRKNYHFDGWYTKAKGGKKVKNTTRFKKNTTLYAHWTRVLTITFNPMKGTVSTKVKKVLKGKKVGKLPNAKRKGYYFDAWYTKAKGGKKITAKSKFNKNTKLYAHWLKGVTVRFNPTGGTVTTKSKKFKDGTSIGKLPVPKRDGYTFDNWYTKKTGGKVVTSSTKFKSSATVYARWLPDVTVTFNPTGGTVSTSKVISKAGSRFGELPVPQRAGYTFSGWYTSDNSTKAVTPTTRFRKTTELYARWETRAQNYSFIAGKTTAMLTKYHGSETDVVIPEIINGYKVKFIGEKAFEKCKSIKSITIPASVTRIGSAAFSECENLEKVNIPNGVTIINQFVFYKCKGLKSVVIPAGVTKISTYAFKYCENLEGITIPQKVKIIGQQAFGDCKKIKKIVIPKSVNTIENSAFYNCVALKSVSVPDSITKIEGGAFSDTAWLNSKKNGIVYIGKIAYCVKGTCPKKVTIKSGTVLVTGGVFSRCENLESITLPKSLKHIGSFAFEGCTSLKSISIPSGVRSIGEYAFNKCTNLSKVSVPNSVDIIGSYAFNKTAWLNNKKNGIVYIGKIAYCVKGTCPNNVTIKSGTKSISDAAFLECPGLSSVKIPSSVRTIGIDAFNGCGNLKSVKLSEGLKTINNSAFYSCKNIKSVTVPKSVTSIGSHAFGLYYIDRDGSYENKVSGFALKGYDKSDAQRYADESGIDFKIIR